MATKENGTNWMDALLSGYQKPSEKDESSMGPEDLEKTAALAFEAPKMKDDSRSQLIASAAKIIADQRRAEGSSASVAEIKQKLAVNEINPVALKVATQEQWDNCSDPSEAEKIAKAAAIEYKEQLKHAWQKDAFHDGQLQPSKALSSRFDPETSKGGIVMSCLAPGDDSVGRPSRVPQNAASILEPDRIDKLAVAKNEHDESVAEAKQARKDKEAERKEALLKDMKDAPPQMSGSQVMRAGGEDRDVFAHRLGGTQISIMDTLGQGKLSPEDLKTWFTENLFSKMEDKKAATKQAQDERRKAIQGEKEKDRSWDAVKKPTSTADLSKGLLDRLVGK